MSRRIRRINRTQKTTISVPTLKQSKIMAKTRQSYTVITSKSITDLAIAVERLFADSWEPQGGVTVCLDFSTGESLFAQALVK